MLDVDLQLCIPSTSYAAPLFDLPSQPPTTERREMEITQDESKKDKQLVMRPQGESRIPIDIKVKFMKLLFTINSRLIIKNTNTIYKNNANKHANR